MKFDANGIQLDRSSYKGRPGKGLEHGQARQPLSRHRDDDTENFYDRRSDQSATFAQGKPYQADEAKKFKKELLNYAGSLRHIFAQEIKKIDCKAILKNPCQIGETDDLPREARSNDDKRSHEEKLSSNFKYASSILEQIHQRSQMRSALIQWLKCTQESSDSEATANQATEAVELAQRVSSTLIGTKRTRKGADMGELWLGKRHHNETCLEKFVPNKACKRTRVSEYIPTPQEIKRSAGPRKVTRPYGNLCFVGGNAYQNGIRRQNAQIMMNMRNECLYI